MHTHISYCSNNSFNTKKNIWSPTTPAAPAVKAIGAVTALSPDEHITGILTAREMEYAAASVGVAYHWQYNKPLKFISSQSYCL